LVLLDQLVFQGHKVLLVLKEIKVELVHKALWAQQAIKVHRVHKVHLQQHQSSRLLVGQLVLVA
jgi:hypothetical protein